MSVRRIALGLALIALVTVPFWVPGIYYINVASQILFYAVFALGLNVLVGKDDTLFATADGMVVFDLVHGRKRVNVVPAEA